MPHLTSLLDFSRPLAFMFDLDGTILDSTPWHMQAYRETLTTYAPHKLSEFNEAMIKGRGSKDVFLALGFTDNKEVSKLTEHKRELYKDFVHNKKVGLFAGVVDLIDILKSRHRTLILVTSSSNNTATLCLEANGLTGIFDYIVTGEQAVFGKPAPDIFQYALRRAQLKPWQAVTIEDSDIGIQASIAAGIPAVLVNQTEDFPNVPMFCTFTELLHHVRSDLEKDEFGVFLQPILREQDVSPEITWDSRLGGRPPSYDPTSDQELFEIFNLASKRSERVRLLRIGGPLLFRRTLTGLLDEKGIRGGSAIKALLDQRIPSIRFLLADPDGVPLLTRLDHEAAGTWGIWRVRYEILRFAKSLCTLADSRKAGELEIGFHQGELIWNLGIVGETTTLLRAYGSGTGHDDSVVSQWLKTGESTFLAESFTNYWEAIARRADTKWMKLDFFNSNGEPFNTNDEPKWPSLYKGNAVRFKELDFDKEDYGTSVSEHVLKICRHVTQHEAERILVSITDKQRESLQYFRPVKMVHLAGVPRFMERNAVVMEKLIGVSLFEIANEISIIGQSQEYKEKASMLLGEILLDTVNALNEFRHLANSVIPERLRKPYEYKNQLVNALTEVKSLIGPISSLVFEKAIEDVTRLGSDLESKTRFPFRDAHLKNRIWVTKESVSEIAIRLLTIDNSALQLEMKNNVKDIDFETSSFNVTPWDDAIHILFFEKSGAGPLMTSVDPIKSYENWWGKVDDETGLWMTVLARSIREFCRRLWYARTMPNTYAARYGLERRDYFLDLALYAVKKLSKYENIKKLLAEVKESPEVWSGIGNNKYKPEIVASHPEMTQPSLTNNCLAFISYRREGGSDTARLISHELRNKGIRTFLDVDDLPAGHFKERLLHEIETTPNFIIILTPGCLVRYNMEGDWLRCELEYAIKTNRNIIPIIKDGFEFPTESELSPTIVELKKYHGVQYDHVLFTATMEKLVSFLKA